MNGEDCGREWSTKRCLSETDVGGSHETMSTKEAIFVVLRILGMVWLLTGIEQAMQIAVIGIDGGGWLTVGPVVRATLGLILLVGTGWVYRVMFSDLAERQLEIGWARLQPIAFSVLGLIFLLRFVPTLVVEAARISWLLEGSRRSLLAKTFAEDWSYYVQVLVGVVLGWMVFRYSEGLSAWWSARQDGASLSKRP